MYAKIKITGCLEVMTGLHIGTSDAFSAIGSVDSPVIRDPLERIPMIPGSSLKGKIRTLLARNYNGNIAKTPDDDDEKLLRLFGSASKNSKHKVGRLLFSDMILSNSDELRKRGVDSLTEVKFENTINRISAEAKPRQIERVIRGSKFNLDLVYELCEQDTSEMLEDFEMICDGFSLLKYDYIGGSGSRGYGKVSFSQIEAKTVIGDLPEEILESINGMLIKVGSDNGV